MDIIPYLHVTLDKHYAGHKRAIPETKVFLYFASLRTIAYYLSILQMIDFESPSTGEWKVLNPKIYILLTWKDLCVLKKSVHFKQNREVMKTAKNIHPSRNGIA
jgi:hypothetical protein